MDSLDHPDLLAKPPSLDLLDQQDVWDHQVPPDAPDLRGILDQWDYPDQ